MSKGIGGIKGYHAGGGVTHTHGPKKKKTGSSYTGSRRGGFTETKQVGDLYKAEEAAVGTKEAQRRFMDRGREAQKDPKQFAPVDYTTDAVSDDKDITTVPTKEDEQYKDWDTHTESVIKKNLGFLQKKLGASYRILPNGKIVFIDKTGNIIPQLRVVDALSGQLDKMVGFNPEKAFDTENPVVAASFADMFENMDKQEFRDFLNRKGNLDRILDYADTLNPAEKSKFTELIQAGDPQALAEKFKQSGRILGDEKFEKAYLKRSDPAKYYELYPPMTSGQMDDLARASMRPGFKMTTANTVAVQKARDELAKSNRGGISDLASFGGGGGGGATPTDPTQPTTVPDYLLAQQYMPGLTPSYTGGPEQMQVAGGYFDPRTGKWIGSPWGTQQSYQGALPGTNPILFANQGGMVNDNGIMGFKKYGY